MEHIHVHDWKINAVKMFILPKAVYWSMQPYQDSNGIAFTEIGKQF